MHSHLFVPVLQVGRVESRLLQESLFDWPLTQRRRVAESVHLLGSEVVLQSQRPAVLLQTGVVPAQVVSFHCPPLHTRKVLPEHCGEPLHSQRFVVVLQTGVSPPHAMACHLPPTQRIRSVPFAAQ